MRPVIKIATSPPETLLENRRRRSLPQDFEKQVVEIIKFVKKKGDFALIKLTEKFDNVNLSTERIKVTEEEIEEAYQKISEEQITAIKYAKKRVEEFERTLIEKLNFEVEYDGVRIYSRIRPLGRVGCYVPSGVASYPSTVIMTVTPAKVAGVKNIAVCTPPRKDGKVEPLTLIAADICGVDEVYRVGGAQAIAALAYGTETIKPVEKIVGPGGLYVTIAKLLVSRDVSIDLPAGPSEILVLADRNADPKIIALDMISQAEHGIWGYSILVTTSESLALKVRGQIEKLLDSIPQGKIVAEALSRNGLILVLENIQQCLSFINEFAPEHVEIMSENSLDMAEKIETAGLVLIGKYTPVAASDYCLGVNHVLPTGGFGRIYSGLSSLDFVRRINIVECSKDKLRKIKDTVEVLAKSEGLYNHALSLRGRFSKDELAEKVV
ncbi:TPA: histidinol dehydrogenase [Candidatus Bathyarchaeota archaeon]|nr:histidinol dehydrogenase [Candidatus Bathyarchaeota archaeon]